MHLSGARFDHVIVAARTLEEGVDWVQEQLGGICPTMGGTHPRMGTHNRLLRLSETAFLEVIAIDPGAPSPGRPRWFGLDSRCVQTRLAERPRVVGWVAAVDDIVTASAKCPIELGACEPIARGDLEWLITIPPDGLPPEGGTMPALIQWPSDRLHPASGMQDLGCALATLELDHAEPDRLNAALDAIALDRSAYIRVDQSPKASRLAVTIRTPASRAVLRS